MGLRLAALRAAGAPLEIISLVATNTADQTSNPEQVHVHVLITRLYFNYFTCHIATSDQGSQEFIPNFSLVDLDGLILFRYQMIGRA